MLKRILILFGVCAVISISYLCLVGTSLNLDYVKESSFERWKEQGFIVEGYEGYKLGFWGFNGYGGAKVWYRLSKKENKITYSGYLQQWGNEIHVYGPVAIDAIQPNNY